MNHLIKQSAGGEIAAIDGLSHATEDQLKASAAPPHRLVSPRGSTSSASHRKLSRAGVFTFDSDGALVTPDGLKAQGYTQLDPVTNGR